MLVDFVAHFCRRRARRRVTALPGCQTGPCFRVSRAAATPAAGQALAGRPRCSLHFARVLPASALLLRARRGPSPAARRSSTPAQGRQAPAGMVDRMGEHAPRQRLGRPALVRRPSMRPSSPPRASRGSPAPQPSGDACWARAGPWSRTSLLAGYNPDDVVMEGCLWQVSVHAELPLTPRAAGLHACAGDPRELNAPPGRAGETAFEEIVSLPRPKPCRVAWREPARAEGQGQGHRTWPGPPPRAQGCRARARGAHCCRNWGTSANSPHE